MSEENNLPKSPAAQASQAPETQASTTPAPQAPAPQAPAVPAPQAPAAVQTPASAEKQPVQPEAPAPAQNVAEQEKQPSAQPSEGKTVPPAPKPAAATEKGAADVMKSGRARRVRASQPVKEKEKAPKDPLLKEETVSKIKAIVSSKLFILAVFLFVLLLSGIGAISSVPSMVEGRLPKYLTQNGLPLKSFKVKTVGLSQAEFTNLVFSAGGMRARTVKVSYSLSDLWKNKQLKSMEISGLTLNGDISEEGVSFGGLENMVQSQRAGNAFFVDSLRFSNGQLVITQANKEEPYTLNFTANGNVKKDSLTLKSDLSFQDDNYSVKTTVSLFKSKAQTTVNAEIVEGNVLEGEKTVGGVTGTLDLAIQDGALTEVKTDLTLQTSKQDMKLAGAVIPKGESFAFDASFSRKFKEGIDPGDNFVGDLSLKSDNIVFKGTAKSATIELPLSLQVASAANKQIKLEKLDIALDGTLSCVDSVCSYKLKKEAPLKLETMQYSGDFNQVKNAEPLQVSLFSKENLFVFQNGSFSFSPALLPFSVKAFILTAESSSQIAVAVKENSQLNLTYNLFSGAFDGNVSFTSTELLTKDFKTTQLSGSVAFSKSLLTEAKFLAKNISLTQEKIIAPFDMQAVFSPANPAEYKVIAAMAMKNNFVTARVDGSYNFASKSWSLSLDVPKTTFSPSTASFTEYFPYFAEKIQAPLVGTLAVDGRMLISKDKKVTGDIKLLLADVSTRIGTFDIQNLTTILNVSSLTPFETSETQNVFIGRLNMGVPFSNVSANFRAKSDGISIQALTLNYADSQFRLMKQMFVPYDGVPNTFLVEAQEINLARLSSLLRVPGLEVDGSGTLLLKLSLDKGAVMIEEGKMTLSKSSSAIGGMFRYDPPSSQKVNLDPRLKAFLTSVIFKDMTLTMRGMLAGKMTFKFDMNGYATADETQQNRKVSLNMENSLMKLLKPDDAEIELPPTVMNTISEVFK